MAHEAVGVGDCPALYVVRLHGKFTADSNSVPLSRVMAAEAVSTTFDFAVDVQVLVSKDRPVGSRGCDETMAVGGTGRI